MSQSKVDTGQIPSTVVTCYAVASLINRDINVKITSLTSLMFCYVVDTDRDKAVKACVTLERLFQSITLYLHSPLMTENCGDKGAT